jgi:hypothetical protein
VLAASSLLSQGDAAIGSTLALAAGPPINKRCLARGAPRAFDLRFLYIRQGNRFPKQPRAGRPFRVGIGIGASAWVRVTLARGGRLRWAYPNHGFLLTSGSKYYDVPALDAGRYRLRVQAYYKPADQKQCLTRQVRLRG